MRSRYSTEPIPVFGKQKADENVGLAVSDKPVIREGSNSQFESNFLFINKILMRYRN